MIDDVLELDDEMPFGKYKDWTIRNILADDADYLRWFTANVNDVTFDSVIEDALENENLRLELVKYDAFNLTRY